MDSQVQKKNRLGLPAGFGFKEDSLWGRLESNQRPSGYIPAALGMLLGDAGIVGGPCPITDYTFPPASVVTDGVPSTVPPQTPELLPNKEPS